MAIRPLLAKYLPGLFPDTHQANTSYMSNRSWHPPLSHKSKHTIWSTSGDKNGVQLQSMVDLHKTESQEEFGFGGQQMGIKKTTQFEVDIETESEGRRSRDLERGA